VFFFLIAFSLRAATSSVEASCPAFQPHHAHSQSFNWSKPVPTGVFRDHRPDVHLHVGCVNLGWPEVDPVHVFQQPGDVLLPRLDQQRGGKVVVAGSFFALLRRASDRTPELQRSVVEEIGCGADEIVCGHTWKGGGVSNEWGGKRNRMGGEKEPVNPRMRSHTKRQA